MLQLGATLLVWASIGAFQATCASKFSVPERPCAPGTPCAAGQVLPPYKPHRKRTAYPAKLPSKKSSSKNSHCLDTFYCAFMQAVECSKVLKDLFQFLDDTPSSDFCAKLSQIIFESFVEIGAENIDFLTQKAMDTITESFDELSADVLMQVYAYSIAKFLITENVLTPQNAAQLAKDYADFMEKGAKCAGTPHAALSAGFVDFLHSLGLFTTENALLISLLFANEFKVAAYPPSLKYRCGSNAYS